jgi:hypothetical protein
VSGFGLSPKTWAPPTTTPFRLANVRAGEWVLVELNYRNTNVNPMVFLPGFFLAHVIYTPNSDDSTPQKIDGRLSSVMYGGSSDKMRSEYRVDPGNVFQVPWDGQIAIVAGGNSTPDVIVDVTIKRGFQPEDLVRDPHGAAPYGGGPAGFPASDPSSFDDVIEAGAMLDLALEDSEFAGTMLYPDPPPLDAGPMRSMRSKRVYPPPVIGSPAMLPATYIALTAGHPPISLPSGAVSMEAFDNSGTPSNPIPFSVTAMGNAGLRFMVQNGCNPRTLGALGQGGGAANCVPATWQALTNCPSVTVWSKIGT